MFQFLTKYVLYTVGNNNKNYSVVLLDIYEKWQYKLTHPFDSSKNVFLLALRNSMELAKYFAAALSEK